MPYQVAVIGGGPGGYTAAIRAAQLGASVAVIEQDALGGTCLNRGCIPTKALLAGADRVHAVREAAAFGVTAGAVSLDYAALVARKDAVVKQLTGGIGMLFKKNKVSLLQGKGRLKDSHTIEVTAADGLKTDVEAESIIIATGSEPALIKALGYDGHNVVTSTEALAWTDVPQNLLVIGGGVIGCEFATVFTAFGAHVTIVEALPTILPMLDAELARRLQTNFKKQGLEIKTKAMIKEVRATGGGIIAVLESGEEIAADKALISIGRQLNTAGLGLAEAGVALTDRGAIVVDQSLRTSVPNVYAVGDVTGRVQLAHFAAAQGIAAAHAIMGQPCGIDFDTVPSCVYTLPELASVGLTKEAAEAKGLTVKVGKFPFTACGKALVAGESDGFVKIVADAATDAVLGVHIMGAHATELIATGGLAVAKKLTAAGLAEVIHAHPTLSEGLLEAAEAVHGLSINF